MKTVRLFWIDRIVWLGFALFVAGIVICVWAWLADRPTDVPPPPLSVSGIIFNPEFGPKTVEAAQKYVDDRTHKEFFMRYGHILTDRDKESVALDQERRMATETLERRWGLTLEMTQEQIDVVLEERRAVWTYIQQSQTLRYRFRTWLGLTK